MTQYHLMEDKFPKKLPILLSYDIINRIELIKEYNEKNTDALSKWHGYLTTVENYISDPVIAWDTMERHIKFPNGTKFIKDFGINVGYSVKFNKRRSLCLCI